MQFHIGTRVYLVKRRWNLTVDNERLDGLCDSSTRTIWLDGDLTEEILVDVLRHEHTHCWEFEVGTPRTPEDRANFTSTVSAAFDAEFAAGGGLPALLAMPIDGTRGKPKTDGGNPMNYRAAYDRVVCGECGAEIMAGSIVSAEPIANDAVGCFMMQRGCRCPVCDAVQVWQERCTADGTPLGEFYKPRLITGPEADAWMEQHQDLHCRYNVA
jgi:hypothetical protein